MPIALLAFLPALVSGCGGGSTGTHASEPTTTTTTTAAAVRRAVPLPHGDATALRVVRVRTPPLDLPKCRYHTSGTYPQVRGGAQSLSAVNDAISHALLAHQRDYVRTTYRRYGRDCVPFPLPYAGVFATGSAAGSYAPETISASSAVVSALIPVRELYPGGNDGDVWMGVTVRVPSGAPVQLDDLLAKPNRGMSALAVLARAQLSHENRCIRAEPPFARKMYWHSFAPTARHSVSYALAPKGLAIGYPIGLVTGPPCGRIETTIPYARVAPFMSKLGKQLAAGVRRPRQ